MGDIAGWAFFPLLRMGDEGQPIPSTISYACPPPLQLYLRDGAERFGWLAPLSPLLANMWAGAQDKGQPLQMTKRHYLYALSSIFPGLCISNLSIP
jgi:hypothetical protein